MSERPWVLITGGALRLGRAVAIEAASRGWNIALHYARSEQAARETAAEIKNAGVDVLLVEADFSTADPLGLITDTARRAGTALTGLINTAAIFEHDTIADLSVEQFERHMRVNALTPVLLSRAFAAALPEAALGCIVNFLDFKLAAPYPDHLSYTLSKYALAGATEVLARALAPRVRVNAISPAYATPALGQSVADFERLHNQTPLNRGTTPEDIGRAVLFLLESPAITGQNLFVDSGLRFAPQGRDFMFR